MSQTAVDRIYTEYRDASSFLRTSGEISLSSAIDANSRKALLLAAASYFEGRITRDVLVFCEEIAGVNRLVPALIQNKAISRQYHTWFDWDRNNANKFFALFGPEFKKHMEGFLNTNEMMQKSVKDFMELGRDRNRLVHEDFATFTLEKTIDEIHAQYASALAFVDSILAELRTCSQKFVISESDLSNIVETEGVTISRDSSAKSVCHPLLDGCSAGLEGQASNTHS